MPTPKAEQAEQPDPPAAERKVPLVQPECVWINKAGSRFAQWDAVAPEGATVEDLLHPSAWKRVQQNRRPPLGQDDEIRIRAFDRSWAVWCIVDHASGEAVKLSKVAGCERSAPIERLFEDDRYAVRFVGNGYGVFRKSDGQRMQADSYVNPALAERALIELYPKRVA